MRAVAARTRGVFAHAEGSWERPGSSGTGRNGAAMSELNDPTDPPITRGLAGGSADPSRLPRLLAEVNALSTADPSTKGRFRESSREKGSR